MQITTYKVHKIEHPDSRQSSMDEHATRAMSGALSSLSLSAGRGAANPLGCDGGSPRTAAFTEALSHSSCFAEVAGAPARLDSGGDNELTLCFTESGCVLRESASFSGEVCSTCLPAAQASCNTRSVNLSRPSAAANSWQHLHNGRLGNYKLEPGRLERGLRAAQESSFTGKAYFLAYSTVLRILERQQGVNVQPYVQHATSTAAASHCCVSALHAVLCMQAPERLDCSGIIGRSISTTCLASPFAATIDLARSGRLSGTGGSGTGPGNALPPKPRGIERRAATEHLPTIPSGALCMHAARLLYVLLP